MSKRSVTTTTSVVSSSPDSATRPAISAHSSSADSGTDGVDDRLGGVDHLDRPAGQLGGEDVLAAVGGDADRPLDRRDLGPAGREHRIVGQRQAVVAELASERHEHGADGDDPDHRSAQLLGAAGTLLGTAQTLGRRASTWQR